MACALSHIRTCTDEWTQMDPTVYGGAQTTEWRMVWIPFGDAVARYACFGWDFGPTSRFSVGNSVSCTDGPQLFCSPNDET